MSYNYSIAFTLRIYQQLKTCLQVTFEGIIGSSYTGDVAIDEVKITQGSCRGEYTLGLLNHRECIEASNFRNSEYTQLSSK